MKGNDIIMYDFANRPLNNSDSIPNNPQHNSSNQEPKNPILANPYLTILGALKVNSNWNASPAVMKNLQFIGLVTPVGDTSKNSVRTNQKKYILTNLGISYVNYAYPVRHNPNFFKYDSTIDNVIDHPNNSNDTTQDMYILRQQSFLANAKNRLYQIIQTRINDGQGHLTQKEFLIFLHNNNVTFNNNFNQFFNIVIHILFINQGNTSNQENATSQQSSNKSTNIFNRPLQDDDRASFNPNKPMKNPVSDTLNEMNKSDSFNLAKDAYGSDTGLSDGDDTSFNRNNINDDQWSDFWND